MEENIYVTMAHPCHTQFPPTPQSHWGLLLETAFLNRFIRDLEEVI